MLRDKLNGSGETEGLAPSPQGNWDDWVGGRYDVTDVFGPGEFIKVFVCLARLVRGGSDRQQCVGVSQFQVSKVSSRTASTVRESAPRLSALSYWHGLITVCFMARPF
jgi:hypothetical protein